MFKAYLTLALYRIRRNKLFSAINILGLAIALTAFYFILAFVNYETSFDNFHRNGDSIYRVALTQHDGDALINASAKTFPAVGIFLNENVPEVEAATRFLKIPANTGFLFGYGGKIFNEPGGIVVADTSFFKVFPSLLVRGDIKTALQAPGSIVISQSVAESVFGDADPLGKTLERIDENGEFPFVVTGILRDIPEGSHLHVKFISKLEEVWPEIIEDIWNPSLIYTYAVLKKKVDAQVVEAKVNVMLDKVSKSTSKIKTSRVFLQPLNDIHLRSQLKDEFEVNGNFRLVSVIFAVGILIMSIAWINYINLETSRFSRRCREIGVRRIVGSDRFDLSIQFLTEFLCVTLFAGLIAAGLGFILHPILADVTGIPFDHLHLRATPTLFVGAVIIALGTICAGVYPGFFLIRMNPAKALKGNIALEGNRFLKKPLLVVQFSASLVLVSFLIIINSQLKQIRTTDRKLDVEKVVAIKNPVVYMNEQLTDKYNGFKLLADNILRLSSVEGVTTSSAVPGTEVGFTYVDLIKRTLNDPYDPTRYKTIFVGDDFLSLYRVKLLAGRHFESSDEGSWKDPWEKKDWSKLILNEKAIKILGFKSPGEAVGQVVKFKAFDEYEDYEIIGVVEDYHHEAAKKDILPMIFKLNFDSFQQVFYSIRLRSGTNPQRAVNDIERTWKTIFPDRPFEYFFMDNFYDQQFKSERKFAALFFIFSAVAIFLASLGILGMAYFEANSRAREISIRKILGATTANLLNLLSRDQIKCTILACALSFPLAWYGAGQWLSSYPIRVQLTASMFILPVVLLLAIILFISMLQTIRAMRDNAIDHLRSE